MSTPDREEQRHLLRMRRKGYARIEQLRHARLRGMPYRWEDVDALLELGDIARRPSRKTSGLIEMQRRLHGTRERAR